MLVELIDQEIVELLAHSEEAEKVFWQFQPLEILSISYAILPSR
jgi:hypothetical protein